ncbi:sensor domain-containing protein (plasmid) [Streptomyces decoyicus]|uniref:sensor domain-containing protein n=1 Tax=Streptomyces decoyicus TaxID=249567 RepID=UPI002E32CA75|nr:sensor domain-containing protein [Streptomyces decoyicus]
MTVESYPGRLGRLPSPGELLRSSRPWTSSVYLASYLLAGPVLFAFTTVVVVVCFALSITVFGVPLLIGAAAVVRVCAHIERARTGLVAQPVQADHRPIAEPGILNGVRARWTDPAVLRDLAYLTGLFVPLLVLDAIALLLWLTNLAVVVAPAWYWAVPDGGGLGALGVDDLPTALVATVVACLLVPLTCYAVVGAARLHSAVAHAVLGRPSDPLAEARRVLANPGPLARSGPDRSVTTQEEL